MHLEVSCSLDTSSFITTLRRFTSRRGNVQKIISDNGTNLVGGCTELKRSIDQWNRSEIGKDLLQRNIEWKFNPPSASHFGGSWEREIRTARKVLYSMLSRQAVSLTDESLHTLMCEVEAIMNNRPLTSISTDPSDLKPLTPNHILLLAPDQSLPPGNFTENETYHHKRWRYVQHLANTFWSRWRREYIVTLQHRQKWRSEKPNFEKGHLVLLVDSNLPRNQWRLGRIHELRRSLDGHVRSVTVRVAKSLQNNNKDTLMHIRHLQQNLLQIG